MQANLVATIRSFNRTVSQRIGALDETYLARGRPLGEARLIFEIGPTGGADVLALRRRLGVDSGYMSRLLRSLERQDLVEVGARREDRRSKWLRLTAKGRKEWKAYDRLSDDLAASILSGLSETQRRRLGDAMAEVERLMKAGSVTVDLEAADSVDAVACLSQYQAELAMRFEKGFDPSQGNSLDATDVTPPAGWFVVARLAGDPIGCGALKRLGGGEGEVKRVWVASSARGLGVASRIMERLETIAREAGFSTVKLDTNRALTEAHALYRKLGYREIGRYNDNPYADHFFEKGL
ncbi:MAG: GNAT family N-acetyltransferase [Rhizobiaceae bacterium]